MGIEFSVRCQNKQQNEKEKIKIITFLLAEHRAFVVPDRHYNNLFICGTKQSHTNWNLYYDFFSLIFSMQSKVQFNSDGGTHGVVIIFFVFNDFPSDFNINCINRINGSVVTYHVYHVRCVSVGVQEMVYGFIEMNKKCQKKQVMQNRARHKSRVIGQLRETRSNRKSIFYK